ncbi:MAG TPA: flagellar modification protein B [Deltaproteobacteria bacterium]|nr:flagellar modification protein B [Deltaproteobacteria bacterium]
MNPRNDFLITICARGGSKGVKNKNIRPLLGKPLIAYTIEQALSWGRAERVVVSTDSPEIAEVAKRYGAEVPFLRPAELATDHAGKLAALKHAFLASEKLFDKSYGFLVDLDATAPVRTRDDLDRCLEDFLAYDPPTLFSVVPARKSPYFNMVEVSSEGRVGICKRLESGVLRRQDAPAVYEMNASIYFYRRDYLLAPGTVSPICETSRLHIMDARTSLDIDTEWDFRYIEFLLKEGLVCL